MRRYSSPELQVQVAYSVKTNPERRLLELALRIGASGRNDQPS